MSILPVVCNCCTYGSSVVTFPAAPVVAPPVVAPPVVTPKKPFFSTVGLSMDLSAVLLGVLTLIFQKQ